MRLLRRLPLSRRARRRLKRARLRLATALGSQRYTWPALYDLDRRLVELFAGRRAGTFLEIGANDGLQQSNTLALERLYDWTGVLVEASPELAAECRRNRPAAQVVCAAAGVHEGLTRVGDRDLVARTGASAGAIVAQVRLSTILTSLDIRELDVAIVDVEGNELEVLQGLDLDRHGPAYFLIETDQPERVAELLAPRYRLVDRWSYHDYLYARSSGPG